jgi:uncharacterized repeat protein (TIGR03806 family)
MRLSFFPTFTLALCLLHCGTSDQETTEDTGGSGGSAGSGGACCPAGSGGLGGAGHAGTSGHAGTGGQSGGGQGGKASGGQAGAGAGGAAGGAQAGGAAGGAQAGGGQAGGGQGGVSGGSGGGGAGVAGSGLATRPANPTCVAFARPSTGGSVAVTPAFPKLSFSVPLLLSQAPGDKSRFFLVQKTGKILTFANDDGADAVDTFANMASKIEAGPNEAGLLGMAFHPKFAENGQVLLSYTAPANTPSGLRSTIARYRSLDGGKTLDLSTEEILLTIDQPFQNHNGGNIVFGPDGYLYAGYGDGGSGGDPLKSGQNKDVLLGKILRIDVDAPAPYGIPQDNPFAQGGGRPEIFAYGMRNTWRFSFDRATGDLWAGDVGQDTYEEVDLIKRGGNYGWNTMEGFHCYGAATCDMAGLTLPVAEYKHTEGVSITGGYVYRGTQVPAIVGSYLYADFGSGKLWGLFDDPMTGKPAPKVLVETGLNISSFGQDNDGELYLLDYTKGRIQRIVAAAPAPPTTVPTKLSETGCVDPADATQPAPGLIPYEVNAPLWSDGAEKHRWFALPDGAQMTVGADGDLDLPVGSVAVKEFRLGGKRIETRLFVRHADGGWAGYSYEWNDAGTDAVYVPGGKTKKIGDQTWLYPSGGQCLACHTESAGRTLGLEFAQLNRDTSYDGGPTANQIATYQAIGLFTNPPAMSPDMLPRLEEPFGDGPLVDRARAYLHSNCSICHRPGGTGQGPADFRYTTPLGQTGACDAMPEQGNLGIADARLIAPGSPEKSLVSVRTHALDSRRMPPLGSSVVDDKGTTLLDQFITSLTQCTP